MKKILLNCKEGRGFDPRPVGYYFWDTYLK